MSLLHADYHALTSEPAGMRVYVDGVFAGQTPMTLDLDFGWLAATQVGVQPAIRYTPVDKPPPSEPTARRIGEERDPPRLRDAVDDFFSDLLTDMLIVLLTPPAAPSHDEPTGSPIWTSTITLDQRPPEVKVHLRDGATIDLRHTIRLRPDDPVLHAAMGQAGVLGAAGNEPTHVAGHRTLHLAPAPPETARTDGRATEPLPITGRSQWLDEIAPQWLDDYDPAVQRRP